MIREEIIEFINSDIPGHLRLGFNLTQSNDINLEYSRKIIYNIFDEIHNWEIPGTSKYNEYEYILELPISNFIPYYDRTVESLIDKGKSWKTILINKKYWWEDSSIFRRMGLEELRDWYNWVLNTDVHLVWKGLVLGIVYKDLS